MDIPPILYPPILSARLPLLLLLQNKRPPLPQDDDNTRFLPRLVSLINACWSPLASARPTSADALEELREAEREYHAAFRARMAARKMTRMASKSGATAAAVGGES